jgi:hypothetical protein
MERFEETALAGTPPDRADPGLRAAASELVRAERRLADTHFGGVMHRFVLGCLVRLHDKPMLDDPETLAWVLRRGDEVREMIGTLPLLPGEAAPVETDISTKP